VRVAVCQFGSQLSDVDANVARGIALINEAGGAGATLACLPELCLTGYLLDPGAYSDHLLDRAAQAEGELARCAAGHQMTLVYGTARRNGSGLSNAIVLQPPGEPAVVYAKTHMDPLERQVFTPGASLVVRDGVGLACCYDLAFPEQPRLLALRGARLIVAPMAWEERRGFVMAAVVPARAAENVAYLVCANQCGVVGQYRFRGRSCVVDPSGRPVAALANDDGLLISDLDLDWVGDLRDGTDALTYPLFQDRRPALYDDLTG
jgi:predicted amidohydrolase